MPEQDWNRRMIGFAEEGDLEGIKLSLQNGANINAKDELANGVTALIVAADYGRYDCVKYLVNHNANVNAMDYSQYTAVILAAEQGHKNCLESLLKHGADPNATDSAAIKLAYRYQNIECLKLLLTYGAKIENLSEKQQEYCQPIIKKMQIAKRQKILKNFRKFVKNR